MNNLNLWNRQYDSTWVLGSDKHYRRLKIMLTLRRTDYGISFIVQILDEQTNNIVNLASVTSINFVFRKPDKTTYSVEGSLYTDGTDGKVTYTSASSDFQIKGIWRLQVNYTKNLSFRTTDDISFEVESLLTDLN